VGVDHLDCAHTAAMPAEVRVEELPGQDRDRAR
jgi:hypothetical protein